MNQPNHRGNIVGLDVGDARIGVARAHTIAKIPEPLKPINNDENFTANLSKLLQEQSTSTVVVGIPRNMSGQETEQSRKIRTFIDGVKQKLTDVNFVFVDESLSSKRADEYMKTNGTNTSQDSISACYILQEYFTINL